MVHSSMKNLEFDRRLQGRRGWIDGNSFEKHLEGLPDVADKGIVVSLGEEDAAPKEAAPAPSATPEPPASDSGTGFLPSQS